MHEVIRSSRLDLVSLGRRALEEALRGDVSEVERVTGASCPPTWAKEEEWLLGYRLEQMRADPASRPWLLRAIVLREPERAMVGYINFHGPPSPAGWAEIGYEIFERYRRRGYATEATVAMFDWAHGTHGVSRFRASVSPHNDPSLGMIRRLGFEPVGRHWDERDGEEIVFERDWPPPHRVALSGTDV